MGQLIKSTKMGQLIKLLKSSFLQHSDIIYSENIDSLPIQSDFAFRFAAKISFTDNAIISYDKHVGFSLCHLSTPNHPYSELPHIPYFINKIYSSQTRTTYLIIMSSKTDARRRIEVQLMEPKRKRIRVIESSSDEDNEDEQEVEVIEGNIAANEVLQNDSDGENEELVEFKLGTTEKGNRALWYDGMYYISMKL